MATYARTVRRGLPRRSGGEPWPPAGVDAPVEASGPPQEAVQLPQMVEAALDERRSEASEVAAAGSTAGEVPAAAVARARRTLRRGLPRVAGGEPWPAASIAVVGSPAASTAPTAGAPVADAPVADVAATATAGPPPIDGAVSQQGRQESTARMPQHSEEARGDAAATPLRRGLPRTSGGEPWPAAGVAPASRVAATSRHDATPAPAAAPAPAAEVPDAAASTPANRPEATPAPAAARTAVALAPRALTPLPFTPTVFPGTGGRASPPPAVDPQRYGPFTRLQWVGAAIIGGGGLLFAAGMAVLAVRWLLSLEPLQDFLMTYPGEYHLPEGAPVGVPAWLGWQHFFNVFLMVLIIRTGLQVRNEKRPSVFWSPRNTPKRKISLALWFHQSLDILWIVNGVIFVVLLFVTGQWMKIVPTSWEVFPNAISAALQYVSLDWPTENGWVNYNSLQQLAYFATVFIAAPLAIATGVRMSGIWPKNAKALNKAYPVEWARAVHFPVMLYFVFFIIVHVALVFATGALRNLNHMYVSLGSPDGVRYADNWTGFWIFAVSMIVIAAGWVAARPLVLAPIARLFGKVSGR